jgi:hypothetical protein
MLMIKELQIPIGNVTPSLINAMTERFIEQVLTKFSLMKVGREQGITDFF